MTGRFELGYDDLPWEWIYADPTHATEPTTTPGARKRKIHPDDADPDIIGAKMGSFQCRLGDDGVISLARVGVIVGVGVAVNVSGSGKP